MGGEKKEKKHQGVPCIFPPKSRLRGRESRGPRSVEGSQRNERAGSLPPCLPELPRRTGEGKEGEARGRWREGGKARLERGNKKGSLQARKERERERNTAARIQRDHKPYASRQQKERERERASSPQSRARQPPDLPESPPKHSLILSASAAP